MVHTELACEDRLRAGAELFAGTAMLGWPTCLCVAETAVAAPGNGSVIDRAAGRGCWSPTSRADGRAAAPAGMF